METLSTLPTWQLFVMIGLVVALLEIFVPGFILFPIGLGFLVASPFVALTSSLAVQLCILTVAEVAVFFLMRRFVPMPGKPLLYSGFAGMVGRECDVIEEVTASRPGYVRLYGDRWQARTYSLKPLAAGSRAVITKLDGNKVLVEPVNPEGVE